MLGMKFNFCSSAKPRAILLTNEEISAIDDFRFESTLLKLALDQIREDPAKPS